MGLDCLTPNENNLQTDCRNTKNFNKSIQPQTSLHPVVKPVSKRDYHYEEDRLLSFEKWPKSAPVVPKDLARDGFIYMGIKDRVICFFCKTNIFDWEKGDVVSTEHRKHCSQCPFVLGKNVDNKPIISETDPISIEHPVKPKQKDLSYTKTTEESYHIPQFLPKHPRFMSELKRLETFKTWPSEYHQKPADLAKAGFIYLGSSDKTKCFCCNGNLMNWDATDIPVVEHARWFPDCSYVKLTKGEKFIRSVSSNATGQTTAIQDEYVTDEFLERLGTAELPQKTENPLPAKVLAVIEVGYSENDIKKTMQQKHKCYADFKDAEALMRFMMQSDVETTFLPSDTNEKQLDEMLSDSNLCSNEERYDKPSPQYHETEKLESILTENKQMKDQLLCKICMQRDMCIVFLPCGHMVCCGQCSSSLRSCPLCRAPIKGTVKTYLG